MSAPTAPELVALAEHAAHEWAEKSRLHIGHRLIVSKGGASGWVYWSQPTPHRAIVAFDLTLTPENTVSEGALMRALLASAGFASCAPCGGLGERVVASYPVGDDCFNDEWGTCGTCKGLGYAVLATATAEGR